MAEYTPFVPPKIKIENLEKNSPEQFNELPELPKIDDNQVTVDSSATILESAIKHHKINKKNSKNDESKIATSFKCTREDKAKTYDVIALYNRKYNEKLSVDDIFHVGLNLIFEMLKNPKSSQEERIQALIINYKEKYK